jgi:membrane associated rhomboid family serine protease
VAAQFAAHMELTPSLFLRGELWQPFTYSFIHPTLIGTLFELLSLWFLASFLESARTDGWVMGLYGVAVLGTALAAVAIFIVSDKLGHAVEQIPLYGCMGGIFGLLIAIGVLYGDTQFLLFFAIGIKARYLAAIYALITFAMLFGQSKMYAFAQLGGALAGLIYIRMAPRRGVSLAMSETWYGLRNQYYRWKRRRAGRKFEVYMRKQGRTVKFDGRGRPIDDDPNDKSRWN